MTIPSSHRSGKHISGSKIRGRDSTVDCEKVLEWLNEVRQARLRVKDMMDQGQQQISEAVIAGRAAVAKPKVAAS